jgi:hypothetical protein
LEAAKIMKELFNDKKLHHFNKDGQFFDLLMFLEKLFTNPPSDTKLLKTIIIKVIPEVIDFLAEAFQQSLQVEGTSEI